LTTRYSIKNGQLAIVYEVASQNAPTLLFLHDSFGCIRTWRDFPSLLAQQTNCNYLIYDRLGYGASSPDPTALDRKNDYLEKEADILNRMITELGIANPILFGHSDGGSIALIAASKENSLIKGILVEAAHIFVEEITLAGIRQAKEDYQNGSLRRKLTKLSRRQNRCYFLCLGKHLAERYFPGLDP
jgi:pimeloyl-ACP methyl ester carboxylesterase